MTEENEIGGLLRDGVWYLFPGASRPAAEESARVWKAAGYRVAVAIDRGARAPEGPELVIEVDYQGYYAAVRDLVRAVRGLLGRTPGLVVCGGDDINPAAVPPWEIGAQLEERWPDGFFVMQPIGDLNRNGKPFGGTGSAAVSPWVGRGWLERAYGGNGPHWCGYHHLHGDEELREVALRAGVYWDRWDLCQFHAHWTRGYRDNLRPERRRKIIERWPEDRAQYQARRAAGFPGAL